MSGFNIESYVDGEDAYEEGIGPSDLDKIPPISEALLIELQSRFAPPMPSPQTTDREDLFTSGSWRVILFLRMVFDHQNQPQEE